LTYIKEELRQVQVTAGDKKFHKQENVLIATTQRGTGKGQHRQGQKNFHKQFMVYVHLNEQATKVLIIPNKLRSIRQYITQQAFDKTIPCSTARCLDTPKIAAGKKKRTSLNKGTREEKQRWFLPHYMLSF
jgi:hypothetical protein